MLQYGNLGIDLDSDTFDFSSIRLEVFLQEKIAPILAGKQCARLGIFLTRAFVQFCS